MREGDWGGREGCAGGLRSRGGAGEGVCKGKGRRVGPGGGRTAVSLRQLPGPRLWGHGGPAVPEGGVRRP